MENLSKSLETSYEVCLSIMKEKAVSFYQAFHLLPKKDFKGVSAVYAFCRYADDITDEAISPSSSEEKLEELKKVLDTLFLNLKKEEPSPSFPNPFNNTNQPSEKMSISLPILSLLEKYKTSLPWLFAFYDTLSTYPFLKEPFLMQIEGQETDADFREIKDLDDFLSYCKNVAGSVGLMLLPIIALPDKITDELINACLSLGTGMQITNILRDIGEDIRERNRIYLPTSLLEKYGISKEDLIDLAFRENKKLQIPKNLISLIEELRSLSKGYYASIFSHINSFKKEARLPLVASALIYHAIEDVIEREDYNCLTKRCYTSKTEQAILLLKAKNYLK